MPNHRYLINQVVGNFSIQIEQRVFNIECTLAHVVQNILTRGNHF